LPPVPGPGSALSPGQDRQQSSGWPMMAAAYPTVARRKGQAHRSASIPPAAGRAARARLLPGVAVRSSPAFAISISAGEVITWSPPTCLTGKCPSGMPFTTMIGDQGPRLEACQFRCHRYPGQMSLRPTAWYGALFSTARPWLHQGPVCRAA